MSASVISSASDPVKNPFCMASSFEGAPLHIRKEALGGTIDMVFYKDPIAASESLILWLGIKQQSMSLAEIDWDVLFVETIIGARAVADVEYVGRQLIVKGWLVNHSGGLFPLPLQLSFEG